MYRERNTSFFTPESLTFHLFKKKKRREKEKEKKEKKKQVTTCVI